MVLRRRTIRAGKLLAVVLGISFATPVRAAEDDTPACRFQLPVVEQNEKYLSQLGSLTLFKDCKTEGSYLYYHHWYSSKMPARRYWARALAVFVVLLGAMLPVVVNWRKTEAHYKVAVSLIGALIVIAQGIGQTFAFETSWRNFMLARMKLEAAQGAWQHEMIKASLDPTD